MKTNFKKQVMAAGLLLASALSLPNVSLHAAIPLLSNLAPTNTDYAHIISYITHIDNLKKRIKETVALKKSSNVVVHDSNAKEINKSYHKHLSFIKNLKQKINELIAKLNDDNSANALMIKKTLKTQLAHLSILKNYMDQELKHYGLVYNLATTNPDAAHMISYMTHIQNLKKRIEKTITLKKSSNIIRDIVESSLLIVTSFGNVKKVDKRRQKHLFFINNLRKKINELVAKLKDDNSDSAQSIKKTLKLQLFHLSSLKNYTEKELKPHFIKKTIIAITKLIITLAPFYLVDSYFNEGLATSWAKKSIIEILINLDGYIKKSLANIIDEAGNTSKKYMENYFLPAFGKCVTYFGDCVTSFGNCVTSFGKHVSYFGDAALGAADSFTRLLKTKLDRFMIVEEHRFDRIVTTKEC